MKYRREVDGLRALAVVPVVLLHAGFSTFSGGFVGVDIFFVISGYLITNILLRELEGNAFSLLRFYERRARRILPALFFVMLACMPFAYAWMLPDDLKNFGQSLVATSLFSNNVLLALTSGYWDLTSEFKPLLHTWSLGVEEQYYIFFPIALMLMWRFAKKGITPLLWVVLIASLLLAEWGQRVSPTPTFYMLPTRAWEIVMGALAAICLSGDTLAKVGHSARQALSLLGLMLIACAVLFFGRGHPSPGLSTVVPTLGAVLIILFANEGTVANRILGHRAMVGIGLISYSIYLWHQPLLAFARIYAVDEPSGVVSACLVLASFVLAYLTWRFIEVPTRRSTLSRRSVFVWSAVGSLAFIAVGLYLNKSYGMPWRVFSPEVKAEDIDKRIYNERTFKFKNDAFTQPGKKKILVLGNSFGRDFVNMTTETFDTSTMEIVYRDELGDCAQPFKSQVAQNLFNSADVIVYASGSESQCIKENIAFAAARNVPIFYIGTKSFGHNLNWIVRLDPRDRPNQTNVISDSTLQLERDSLARVPPENYISVLAVIAKNDRIPITDEAGQMISTDRAHLTKYGAIYVGQRVLRNSRYADAILRK